MSEENKRAAGEIPMRAQSDNQPPPACNGQHTWPTMARMFDAECSCATTPAPKPRTLRHHVAGAELWLFNDTGVLVRGDVVFELGTPSAVEIAASGDVLSASYPQLSQRPASPAERALWREALSRQADYQASIQKVQGTLEFLAAAIGTIAGPLPTQPPIEAITEELK